MSNVVTFLETLGGSSQSSRLSSAVQASENDAFVASVLDADLPQTVKDALLKRDPAQLAMSLDCTRELYCFLLPAEEDEPSTEEESDPDDSTEEREEKPSHARQYVAAA